MKLSVSLTIFAALCSSAALRAQDVVQLPLERVCEYAKSRTPRTVTIKTISGETVEGACFSVDVNEIQIDTGHGLVKVAKAQLSRVTMAEIPRRHQLAHLHRQVHKGVRDSAKIIPTEYGIFGVIGVPLVLAGGAVG